VTSRQVVDFQWRTASLKTPFRGPRIAVTPAVTEPHKRQEFPIAATHPTPGHTTAQSGPAGGQARVCRTRGYLLLDAGVSTFDTHPMPRRAALQRQPGLPADGTDERPRLAICGFQRARLLCQ